jgi:miniconductance mechanosensitive channel
MAVQQAVQEKVQDSNAAADLWEALGLEHARDWLTDNPVAATGIGLAALLIIAIVADKVVKAILLASVHKLVGRTKATWDDKLEAHKVFHRLAHLAPVMAVIYGVDFIPGLADEFKAEVIRLTTAAMDFVLMLSLAALLSAVDAIYSFSPLIGGRSIKTYTQLGKIFVYAMGSIIVVASLMGRSPLPMITGLGAVSAVLLLVFKDTILSFIASLQMSSYDMVRVGDWIEMPSVGADGDVTEIGLHTVKVQNWNKTITTIPTHRLISDSFKNWRGMKESGGRRIKRSINLDMNTVKFCDPMMLDKFRHFEHIAEYIDAKQSEIDEYNAAGNIDRAELVNGRRMTNVGTFRSYVIAYLKNHPKINQNMTFLVRQLHPTECGLPIEIYVFSSDTVWANYEAIQADIFDHILAVTPEFGLRVFQNPTGSDFSRLASSS